MNLSQRKKTTKERLYYQINASKCSVCRSAVRNFTENSTGAKRYVFIQLVSTIYSKSAFQISNFFLRGDMEEVKPNLTTASQERVAEFRTSSRILRFRTDTGDISKAEWSPRRARYRISIAPSTLSVVSFLVLTLFVYIPSTSFGEPLKVRIHAIIPSHFAMTTELNREFHNAMLNFRRDFRNQKFRSLFNPEGDITFINHDTPKEILDTFCKEVLGKQATTILNINNPLGIRRRTSSNEYIVELASYLGIPMISWDSQYSGASQADKILQLAPTIEHQASAMVSLLERYNWTSFTIITSQVGGDAQFVSVVENLVEMSKRKVSAISGGPKRDSLEILSTVHIRRLSDVRPMLEKLVGADTRVFLLHSSSRASYDILEAATQLGLTGRDFIWILTRSSIPTGKFGPDSFPVGLLGISFDYNLDAMKRAVRVGVKTWLHAMLDMFSKPGVLANRSVRPQFTCEAAAGQSSWKDGEIIYRYLLNTTVRDEPHAEFNENGTLKNTQLLVVNLQWHEGQREKTEWTEVGKWLSQGLTMRDITWPGEATVPPTGKPRRAFLRVSTLNELPYVIYRLPGAEGLCEEGSVPCHVFQRDKNKNLVSNSTVLRCCVGLSMDLLRIFSTQLNFDFVLTEVEDGKWGSINKETKTWNGLVKELLDNKADIVMTATKINPERAQAVRFSVPYLETGIKIIVALREGAISPTAFLEPYDYASWSFILIFSVHATGSSILIFEWLSPYGLNMGQTPKREHRFSLFRAFWLIWSMLFSTSVPTTSPKGIASRFLANIWALFALVFLASYTANLAAFMITKEEFYDLSGIKDHRLQNPYTMNPPFKYATVPNGSTEANIRANHKDMYNYMKPYNQPDVDAGIAALKTGHIQAFIYDSSVLEYYASRDPQCRLVTVGNRYAMTGYGVGFHPNLPSHWIDKFNRVILRLQETGELDRLQKFWLAGACKSTKEANLSNRTLGILNFTSAFILLGSGILLGLVILCFEHMYFFFWRKYLRALDKCDCCSLVSMSMGRSLQLHDEAPWYEENRGHCKDQHCERQIWKLQQQLHVAMMKIDKLQDKLGSPETDTLELPPATTRDQKDALHFITTNNTTLTSNGTGRRTVNNPVSFPNVAGVKGDISVPDTDSPQMISLAEVYGCEMSSENDSKYRIKMNNTFNDNGEEVKSPHSKDEVTLSIASLPDLEKRYLQMNTSQKRINDVSTVRTDSLMKGRYTRFGNTVRDSNPYCDSILPGYDSTADHCPVHTIRRTPSYTSAIGESMTLDLTPPGSRRFGEHSDGSRYSILSNNEVFT